MLSTPAADGPTQPSPLGRINRPWPPGEGAAPLHLHHKQLSVLVQHKIEFAPAAAPVALQQMPAPPLQKLRYPGFRLNTAGLRCHPNAISTCLKDSPLLEPIKVSRSLVFRMRSRLLSLVGAAALGLLLVLTGPSQVNAAMDVAKQVLIGADYSDKDLRGATFNLSNLREANLSGSDLRGASLYGAKLQDADLSGTDLREATLDAAVMTGTNLSNAVLEGAFAFNTRFVDVTISGADFTDVPMRGDQLKSLCAVADGTNPVTGRSTRDSLGCG